MKIDYVRFLIALAMALAAYHATGLLGIDVPTYLFAVLPVIFCLSMCYYFMKNDVEIEAVAITSFLFGMMFPWLDFVLLVVLMTLHASYPAVPTGMNTLVSPNTPLDALAVLSVFTGFVAAVVGLVRHFIFGKKGME